MVGCVCKEFVRGSTGSKCDGCKHSPVRHKELNPISIPAQASPTTIVVSAQSDTPAQQLNPDSTHYIAAPQVIQQQGISQQPQPIQPMQQPQLIQPMQQPQLIQQPQPITTTPTHATTTTNFTTHDATTYVWSSRYDIPSSNGLAQQLTVAYHCKLVVVVEFVLVFELLQNCDCCMYGCMGLVLAIGIVGWVVVVHYVGLLDGLWLTAWVVERWVVEIVGWVVRLLDGLGVRMGWGCCMGCVVACQLGTKLYVVHAWVVTLHGLWFCICWMGCGCCMGWGCWMGCGCWMGWGCWMGCGCCMGCCCMGCGCWMGWGCTA